ncbi:hypothetical protein B0H16DRAFT_704592 [Mycena metata]|uniref:Secreted protein n=1 Tax=Mycena metata TaxID=1033252 RepID=A0AAD7M7Z5_9AGAR|nr:hypothetical protein B0H16DRAFT_704592 [Mycena metata]
MHTILPRSLAYFPLFSLLWSLLILLRPPSPSPPPSHTTPFVVDRLPSSVFSGSCVPATTHLLSSPRVSLGGEGAGSARRGGVVCRIMAVVFLAALRGGGGEEEEGEDCLYRLVWPWGARVARLPSSCIRCVVPSAPRQGRGLSWMLN